MAEDEQYAVELQDRYYQDSFGKLVLIIASVITAIALLVGVSVYLHLNKPPPKTFSVGADWRIFPPVPLDQPYLSQPELAQWAADTVRRLFVFDFNNYSEQLKGLTHYFTEDGWKGYLDQLNIYANADDMPINKTFVQGAITGTPSIISQGLYSGRWAWWVQIPFDINYAYAGNAKQSTTQSVTLQLLVVRVSTLNNLLGVAIDKMVIVSKNT